MALANTKPIPEDLVSHCPGQHSQNPEGEPGLARDQQTSVYFPVPQTIASYRGCHSQPPHFPAAHQRCECFSPALRHPRDSGLGQPPQQGLSSACSSSPALCSRGRDLWALACLQGIAAAREISWLGQAWLRATSSALPAQPHCTHSDLCHPPDVFCLVLNRLQNLPQGSPLAGSPEQLPGMGRTAPLPPRPLAEGAQRGPWGTGERDQGQCCPISSLGRAPFKLRAQWPSKGLAAGDVEHKAIPCSATKGTGKVASGAPRTFLLSKTAAAPKNLFWHHHHITVPCLGASRSWGSSWCWFPARRTLAALHSTSLSSDPNQTHL